MPAQRWRLIVARSSEAPVLGQREQLAAWQAMIDAAGLDDPGLPDRPKLVFAAPLAAGASADCELVDLLLPRRLTSAEVRQRTEPHLPAGHTLMDLHDVWLGEPPLTAQVVAADYRVVVTTGTPPNADLRRAVDAFMAGETLPDASATSRRAPADVRALVEDLRVLADCELWLRATIHATRGTGRPDDVVAILAAIAGAPLRVEHLHRERVWLVADSPRAGTGPTATAG